MKNKTLFLAASALAVMALAGCGQRSAEENKPNTTGPDMTTPAPDTNTAPGAGQSPTNSPGTNNPPAATP